MHMLGLYLESPPLSAMAVPRARLRARLAANGSLGDEDDFLASPPVGTQWTADEVMSLLLCASKAPLERSKQSNAIGAACAKAAGAAIKAALPKVRAERKRSEEVMVQRCGVAPVGHEFSISFSIGSCDERNHCLM